LVVWWPMLFVGTLLAAFLLSIALRRLALATGFVDRAGPVKVHSHDVPYLGGVAIAVTALAVWPFRPDVPGHVIVVAIAAIAILTVGLLDDLWNLNPFVRLAAECGAAVAVVAANVRAEPFGNASLDVAVTIVWIVGITNALNLLDNMDGLAAGVAGVAAAGVFTLAAILGQEWLATASLGLAGACCGFLIHNWRPASIYMGDAGSLFLGFVLSIAVLDLRPDVTPPRSLLVPALLLALPVLDTALVSCARIRHGRSVLSGGTDHVSHRLVKLGLAPGVAVGLLVAVEAGLAALAVAYGADAVPFWLVAGLGGLLIVAVAVAASHPQVYEEEAVGFVPGIRAVRVSRPYGGAAPNGAASNGPAPAPVGSQSSPR